MGQAEAFGGNSGLFPSAFLAVGIRQTSHARTLAPVTTLRYCPESPIQDHETTRHGPVSSARRGAAERAAGKSDGGTGAPRRLHSLLLRRQDRSPSVRGQSALPGLPVLVRAEHWARLQRPRTRPQLTRRRGGRALPALRAADLPRSAESLLPRDSRYGRAANGRGIVRELGG